MLLIILDCYKIDFYYTVWLVRGETNSVTIVVDIETKGLEYLSVKESPKAEKKKILLIIHLDKTVLLYSFISGIGTLTNCGGSF